MEVTTVKIVVTGPFNAGKTTVIDTLSEIPTLGTETTVSESGTHRGEATTVAMDFGKLSFADPDVPPGLDASSQAASVVELYLFGTPGQDRFDFMWEVLARGMMGYILMVDATSPETWPDAAAIGQFFQQLSTVPVVVGANRVTEVPEDLRAALGLPEHVPLVACDGTDRGSARDLLLRLLLEILARVDGAEAEAGAGAEAASIGRA